MRRCSDVTSLMYSKQSTLRLVPRAHFLFWSLNSAQNLPLFVMSQKTETKKEEFRKYLESAGVLDALTKVLVGLYEEPEKPQDPLVFLKQQLHGGLPEPVDAEMLRRENEDLQKRNRDLEAKVAELTAALAKHEGDAVQGDTV